MAFETLTPLISYPADGVTTTFAIPDKFYDASDVKLFYVDADGIEGQYDFGTDYSVVITATDPTPPARKSGNVVLVTPPLTGLSIVVFIWPDSDQDQPFEGQPVTPRQNERVLDRLAMRDAALRELLFRGFRAPLNAAPALRYIEVGAAGRVPVYAPDGSGSLVQGPTVGEVALVSGIVDEIIAVAAISTQVVAVAGNATNINLIASNLASVISVGANIGSIVAVAGSIANVNTVAANIAAVNNVSLNMASVVDAVNQATAAAASALLASRFATYPEDTDIPGQGGLRSALHWAAKAAASAGITLAQWVGAVTSFDSKATPAASDLFGFVQASDSTGRKLTFTQLIAALFTNANALTGSVVQSPARSVYSANANISAVIPMDSSTPQNTEGEEILVATITPRSATNLIRAHIAGMGVADGAGYLTAALFVNSDVNATDAQAVWTNGAGQIVPMVLDSEWVAGSVALQTVRIRVGPTAGINMRLNGVHTGSAFSTIAKTKLWLEEIKA